MLIQRLNGLKIYSDGRVINIETDSEIGYYSSCRNRYIFKHKGVEYDKAFVIASLFVQNPDNYKYIIFKDGDISNLNAENLEWSPTRIYYKRIEIYSSKYNKEYILIDKYYNDYDFFTMEEIASKFNISVRTARRKYKENKTIRNRYKITDTYQDIE